MDIKIPVELTLNHNTFDRLALSTLTYEDFLKALSKVDPELYTIKFNAMATNVIKKVYATSPIIRIRNYIANRIKIGKFKIFNPKIYVNIFTITGIIHSEDNLYIKIEMPEDDLVRFDQIGFDNRGDWYTFFRLVKKQLK